MTSATHILARGLAMPPPPTAPTPVRTHCALTGVAITTGYPVRDIVPSLHRLGWPVGTAADIDWYEAAP